MKEVYVLGIRASDTKLVLLTKLLTACHNLKEDESSDVLLTGQLFSSQ